MLGIFKNYIEKRIELLKLEVTESTVKMISIVVYSLLLLVFAISFFSFLFVGIGLVLGSLLGSYAYGFLIVSAFFLLCLLVVFYQKRSIIEYFREKFIQTIFTEE